MIKHSQILLSPSCHMGDDDGRCEFLKITIIIKKSKDYSDTVT